jgi:hypothetical protein
MRTFDLGALDASEIGCVVCEARGSLEIAQSVLLTATRNFFFCGSCQNWLVSDINQPEMAIKIADRKLITALNYYYMGQMQMAEPLLPEIARTLRQMYRKLQDFLIGVYGVEENQS